ncbi:mitochondrial tRNA methylthiotransferase CDK5RAP1-like [Polyodon spathula]|uniref:mitochondrial tRNA methylthiotransferase CDK5RAP1-like n=1 Tax=Polyodon spathula TaxID=7913 RepID=UPI001B7E2B32|nr:mitochondrial tRNA methylthiotransferase CDK5RAP1-like [Polyodon spathula]
MNYISCMLTCYWIVWLERHSELSCCVSEVCLSRAFIAGFCGETEEDHLQIVSLLREVRYNVGFLFAYSMRKKTHAYHCLQDDVPGEVKQLIRVFREEAASLNLGWLEVCSGALWEE